MSENLTSLLAQVNRSVEFDGLMADLRRNAPYTPVMFLEHPHGNIVGVRYEQSVPVTAMKALPDLECELAVATGQASVGSFVAGRIAIHRALEFLGCSNAWDQSISRDSRGAPMVPDEFVGSITHKDGFAFAIASRKRKGIGIDVESIGLVLPRLASRTLCDEETREIGGFASEERWRETITRFSIKEAAYKAVARYLCPDDELQFKDISTRLPRHSRLAKGRFRNASATITLRRAARLANVLVTYAFDQNLVLSTAQLD